MRIARTLEIVVGAVFVAGAVLKGYDLCVFQRQIALYGVVSNPDFIWYIARGVTTLEVFLGAGLIAGMSNRRLLHGATAALLVGFSGLVTYAWVFEGLKDCGCMGKYAPMTPGQTVVKNAVFLMMLGVAYWLSRKAPAPEPHLERAAAGRRRAAQAVAGLCIVVTLLGMAGAKPCETAPAETPFAQFVFQAHGQTVDLGKGTWFVAFYSAACEHCMSTVETVNEFYYIFENVEFAALMLGEPEELETFRLQTTPEFQTFPVEAGTFFAFLKGNPAPPYFYLVHDGEEAASWKEPPSPDELLEAVNALPR